LNNILTGCWFDWIFWTIPSGHSECFFILLYQQRLDNRQRQSKLILKVVPLLMDTVQLSMVAAQQIDFLF